MRQYEYQSANRWQRALALMLVVNSGVWMSGCLPSNSKEVVVYSALDGDFAEPVLKRFEHERGIVVRPAYDAESTKTVGLVTRIISERRQPSCDVFWNNEILHTLRLEKLGLLDAYLTPAGDTFPDNYRSREGLWYGLAARARVLIVNTDLVADEKRPTSIEDLVDPQWQGQVGIAKPLFGTTATHASVLFAQWGNERAEEFFRDVKKNAQVLSGNKQVALSVARGELAFGLTDTDDAIIELEAGEPVAIVFPDQQEGQMGTLFIPNTICVIQGGQNPAAARQLIEYLLSPAVEQQLAAGPSAQFPINHDVTQRSRIAPEHPIRWAEVDFYAAAAVWDHGSQFLKDLFATAQ